MRGFLCLFAGLALTAPFSCVQAQVITTIAGTDFSFPATPIAAVNAPVGAVAPVAVDSAGNVYFADTVIANDLVFKIDTGGTLTVVAGNGTIGYSGDGGPATSAALDFPAGLAVDASGNLYIVDTFNELIRKVTSDGIISTVAGNGATGFSGDGGLAINASFRFNGVGSIAVDVAGDLFIVDQGNNRIRKVAPDGIITTVAGDGAAAYSGDGGLATSTGLGLNVDTYTGVAVDPAGNLYIADCANSRIRKVNSGGIISTLAGNGTPGFSGDGGTATKAELDFPGALAIDAAGNLYIADEYNARIRKVTPGGIISTVAGNGTVGYAGDGGLAISAELSIITGVAADSAGNIYAADNLNDRIRKITAAGVIGTLAGNGKFRYVGDGGLATSASLNYPSSVAVDPLGNISIADVYNDRVRTVTSGGIIGTSAGNGTVQFSGDGGPGPQAGLFLPFGVAVDAAGDIFVADTDHARIREVTSGGIINTIAGDGIYGNSGDGGPAANAELDLPVAITTDGSGNLYIADNQNHRIRKVAPGGIISTVAGNGTQGYAGDGGAAINAELSLPTGVAVDPSGNLFIADSGNDRIRRVTPDGVINTVAGNGKAGYSGDGGPALNASLNLNGGAAYDSIAVDSAGNLFIADYFNNRIRKVTPGGAITTVAGDGLQGYLGDGGLATNASLDYPAGVTLDTSGNLYIADTFNQRIREVLTTAPGAAVSPQQLQFSASSGGAPSAPQNLSFTSPVEGLPFTVSIPAGVNWLEVSPANGASPRLIQVTANPANLAPNTYQTIITVVVANANPSTIAVPITFQVTAALAPTLSLDKASLSFPYPQNGSARSQTVTVSNTGGGSLPFSAAATTSGGGQWLSVSPAAGQALPGSPVALTITANPSGLAAGAYSGQVTVTAGSQSQVVAVTMTISSLSQAILLSQAGLSFLGVQGGGVVPAQSFGVQNIGSGVVNWTASMSTLAGGSSWLQVSPASGSSNAAAAASPRVTVSVDASALSAGTYYGLVRIDAPGAANSPQVLTVFLQVLPPNAEVAGVVQPSQLVFTASAGGESPGSQIVQVYNIVSAAKSFQSQVNASPGLAVITRPRGATLNPQQPTSIVVQPLTTNLNAGVYNAVLTLQFSDGTISPVQITVIVSNTGAVSSSAKSGKFKPAITSSCTPSKLFPVLTTLGPTFTVSAGWPTALAVSVEDDCGMPLQTTGSVTVNFSDGEPPLSLQAQGSGDWEGTWPTGNAATGVTLKIHAANPQGLAGDQDVTGNLASQQQPPVFSKSGITNAAVVQAFTALAPGAAISIYGSRLAESTASASALPLPAQLVDTQVFIAGTSPGGTSTGLLNLPLYYVSENQVNALVPYEVSVNTSLQLLVQRGSTYSMPIQIDMAQAQPAVFGSSLLPGSAGLIYDFPVAGGQPYLVSGSAPAHPADTIVLYCAGLGTVNPGVADGAAPGQQLSNTSSTPQVTIGGQSAHVQFAGLAPGFTGLYQVNAVVPSGAQTGANVPITLTIDGQTSPAITIAIQ
ncbi:MAG TPA: hypothetical protein VME17_17210 [Bryobacteraceae bacterium]|nr:hypothetical protein [Bryobacteraceae bacterium]